MTRRPVAAVGAALALAVASYAVHDLAAQGHAAAVRSTADPAGAALALDPPSASTETARLISSYEAIAHGHRDEGVDVMLGSLYLQRGKLTGDLGTYQQALAAATAAVHLAPRDPKTQTLLASARFSLHDWAGARAAAVRALSIDPHDDGAAVIAADCDVETGRYADAGAVYQLLSRKVSGSASLTVRQARLAWATGDLPAARRLADLALRLAPDNGATGPGLAFYDVFASQLAIDAGGYADARRYARAAVAAAPAWHVALAALGRADAASGDLDGAITAYRQAVQIVPQPDYLAALGDLLTLTGDARGGQQEYATVGAIIQITSAQRGVYNRQLVLYAADHSVGVAMAVRMARAELVTRHDAAGYDALAWALHAAGQDAQARGYSDHALSISAVDPRFEWHAAAIAVALGDKARARMLLTDVLHRTPVFDPLQSRHAAALLASLGGAS